MKTPTFVLVSVLLCVCGINVATAAPLSQDEEQIAALERAWAAAIQRQDVAAMSQFLSPNYFLAIAVLGDPLKVVPRAAWLDALKAYETKSFNIDDLQVHFHGDTAIVLMLCTQQAIVRGQDRSGQFLITDVWVKEASSWHVAERHSSRPEPKAATRP